MLERGWRNITYSPVGIQRTSILTKVGDKSRSSRTGGSRKAGILCQPSAVEPYRPPGRPDLVRNQSPGVIRGSVKISHVGSNSIGDSGACASLIRRTLAWQPQRGRLPDSRVPKHRAAWAWAKVTIRVITVMPPDLRHAGLRDIKRTGGGGGGGGDTLLADRGGFKVQPGRPGRFFQPVKPVAPERLGAESQRPDAIDVKRGLIVGLRDPRADHVFMELKRETLLLRLSATATDGRSKVPHRGRRLA